MFEALKRALIPSGSKLWENWYSDDPIMQLADVDSTDKWHPIIYSIANCNLELTKSLIQTSLCNIKKCLKIPGLYNTQMLYKIFPLVIAITHATSPATNFSISIGASSSANPGLEMFKYFWEDLGGYLWNEEHFECLFKLICRRELTDLVPALFSSRTTQAIFEAMSFQYRFSFIERILTQRTDMLEDI